MSAKSCRRVAGVIFGAAIFWGCGAGAPESTQPDSEAPKIVAANEVVTETSGIPESFPDDVPLYPEWTLRRVNAIEAAGTFDVEATTAAAPSEVANYLTTEAKAKGWAHRSTNGSPGDAIYMSTYAKENRTLTITILAEGEGYVVHVTTG